MMKRRGSILICVLMLVVSSYMSIASTAVPFGDKFGKDLEEIIPEEQTNISWTIPFENLTKFKNRWWERFASRFGMNESELEQEWNEWQRKWQERFNETSESFKKAWKNATKNFQKMKQNHSFIGRLNYENGYCVGNFIKFLFDEGDIVDYTLIRDENVTVFDFVHISGFAPGEPETHGSVWKVKDSDTTVEIHDNPIALLKIKAVSSITIDLNLADNIFASSYKNSSNIIKIYGEIEGKIILAGNGNFTEISNDTVSISVDNEGMLLFMASPLPDVSINVNHQEEYEEKLAEAIKNGKVCARLMVQPNNETDNMIFSDANISCNTFKNKIRVILNSSGEGKVVVIDVHEDVLNLSKDIVVTLDNLTIPMAKDYDDILNIEENETAEYLVLSGANGIQVLVAIPSFSTHTIEIYASQSPAAPETGEEIKETPGFEIAMVLISLVAAIILVLSISKRRY